MPTLNRGGQFQKLQTKLRIIFKLLIYPARLLSQLAMTSQLPRCGRQLLAWTVFELGSTKFELCPVALLYWLQG